MPLSPHVCVTPIYAPSVFPPIPIHGSQNALLEQMEVFLSAIARWSGLFTRSELALAVQADYATFLAGARLPYV